MKSFVFLCICLQSVELSDSENILLTSQPWELTEAYPTNPPFLRLIHGNPYELQTDISLYTNTTAYFVNANWLRFFALATDHHRNITYIHEYATSVISVSNTANFSENSVYHNGLTGSVFNRIAIDWVSDNVYWTDVQNQWICVQPGFNKQPANNQYKILSHSKTEIPHGIAADPLQGYLFWSDLGPTKKIVRMSLDGTDRLEIVTTSLKTPISLAADHDTSRLYWVDLEEATIEYVNYDGTNRTILKRRTNFNYFDISIYKDILVVTELNQGYVYFYNKNTGVDEARFYNNTGKERYYNVAIDSQETQPMVADRCVTYGCGDICVSGASNPTCLCREGFILNEDSRTCTENFGTFHRALVVANISHICLFDIRSISTNPMFHEQKCIFKQTVNTLLDNGIKFIELDMVERRVIYATNRTIFTIQIENTNTMLPILATVQRITGLSYDWSEKKIYWSEGEDDGAVHFYSFQTRSTKRLITGLTYPRDLLLVPQNRIVLWSSGTEDLRKIERCNLDGSGHSVLVDPNDLYAGTGLNTLVADRINDRLYWLKGDTVWWSNFGGTDIIKVDRNDTVIFHEMEIYKTQIVLVQNNNSESYVWVVDKRAPFPIENTLRPIDGEMIGIRVLDDILQPRTQGLCEEQNGGCAHICVMTGSSKQCECETGYQLQPDMMSCHAEPIQDEFILVADQTHSRLYQISTTDLQIRGLNTGHVKGPTGIAYNHVTNHLIWGEQFSGSVKTSSLDGNNARTVLQLGNMGSYPERFAIDFHSGNIYFTFVKTSIIGKSGIGVITPSDKYKTILETGSLPQDIAIDPESGLMFWTDMGEETRHVKKSALDGSSIYILLPNIRWPRGLAVDTKLNLVYVVDSFTDELFQCYYSGGCQLVYKKPFDWPVDLDFSGNYLYYTSWNHQYITRVTRGNYSDVQQIGVDAELGLLYTLYVYSSSNIQTSVHAGCQSNGGLGPCSTLCLPRLLDYTCACEDGVALLENGVTCENTKTTTQSTSTTSTTTTSSTAVVTTLVPQTLTSDDNIALIAGSVAGGVVLVLVICLLLVFIILRSKRSKRSGSRRSQSSNNSSSYDGNSNNPAYSKNSLPSGLKSDQSLNYRPPQPQPPPYRQAYPTACRPTRNTNYDVPRNTIGTLPDVRGYISMSGVMSGTSSTAPSYDSQSVASSDVYNTIDPRHVSSSKAPSNASHSRSKTSSKENFYLQPRDVMSAQGQSRDRYGRKHSASSSTSDLSGDYITPSSLKNKQLMQPKWSSNRSLASSGHPSRRPSN